MVSALPHVGSPIFEFLWPRGVPRAAVLLMPSRAPEPEVWYKRCSSLASRNFAVTGREPARSAAETRASEQRFLIHSMKLH